MSDSETTAVGNGFESATTAALPRCRCFAVRPGRVAAVGWTACCEHRTPASLGMTQNKNKICTALGLSLVALVVTGV